MKKVILVIILILAIGAVFFYGRQFLNKEPEIINSIGNGTILEVKDGSVVVQGYLEAPDTEKKVITVEFIIDEKTQFKKTAMVVDVKKHSDGQPFTPEMTEVAGSFSELNNRTNISGVKTNDKLEDGGTARALEIHYKGVSFQ